MKKKLVICGGGNSAHALIPLLKDSIFDVYIYTSRPNEWSYTIELEEHDPQGNICRRFFGELKGISSNAAELMPDADYIFLCMPVHKYRLCLDEIAPFISREKLVIIGAAYGQAGFNWMVEEVKRKYDLTNIVYFAFGLIPWTSRAKIYGKCGVLFGFKQRTYAAVYPREYFNQISEEFFDQISYRWAGKGKTENSDNFLSLTLSVDNQIIHTSRCYGLFKVYGKSWENYEEIPMFYRDYDYVSANELIKLDEDYSKIRNAIIARYANKDYHLMLDYLSLDRYTFDANENETVLDSFLNSPTLGSIRTPVVQNKEGKWEIDKNNRFFMDDIYYGICIAKWMAEQLVIDTPKIDEIIQWAQMIRNERLIDEDNHLIIESDDLSIQYKSGVPCFYGINSIEGCID